jgi:hypothetical protein
MNEALRLAVEGNDTTAIAALLSPEVTLNGTRATSVADAAAEIARRVGGSRCPDRRFANGQGLLTCVSAEGNRVVVRFRPRESKIVEIELL